VRPHDQEAVGVGEIHLEGGRAAAAERGPQTGDRGRVSYPGLVLDVDDPRADAELLDEVVLLVVEGRAAEERDGRRLADPPAVRVPLAIRAVARLTEPLGDPIHRPLEGDLLPLRPSGPPVEDPRQAPGVDRVLECARALGAEGALVDRALRV